VITKSRAEATLAICMLAGACAGIAGCASPRFDLGPVASADVAPDGNERLRSLGPVFEKQQAADGKRFLAVRPFLASVKNPEERILSEFVWPVGMKKEFGTDRFWRFLTAYGNDFNTSDPGSRYRFVIFPFIFAGRDKAGEGYFALFPLGGTIHEYLRRDRIAFLLFPLYGWSAVGDARTTSLLWPIVSRTRGDGVSRFRAFPFYGRSFSRDCWTKQFVCWPVWTSVRYEYPDAAGDGGFVLFPLFGRLKYKGQKTLMLVPPLFRWTAGEGEKRVFCPWPFFQYSKGQTDKLYLWPLWGKKSSAGMQSSFLLWPVVRRERVEQRGRVTRRLFIAPFVVSEVSCSSSAGGTQGAVKPDGADVSAEESPEAPGDAAAVDARYFKLWPIFSWGRESDDSRFRMLELWPTRDLAPVERNFSPFWTLYSRVSVDDVCEHELLWGIFRRRTEGSVFSRTALFPFVETHYDVRGEACRGLSILKGLFEYRRAGLRKSVKLLYFLELTL